MLKRGKSAAAGEDGAAGPGRRPASEGSLRLRYENPIPVLCVSKKTARGGASANEGEQQQQPEPLRRTLHLPPPPTFSGFGQDPTEWLTTVHRISAASGYRGTTWCPRPGHTHTRATGVSARRPPATRPAARPGVQIMAIDSELARSRRKRTHGGPARASFGEHVRGARSTQRRRAPARAGSWRAPESRGVDPSRRDSQAHGSGDASATGDWRTTRRRAKQQQTLLVRHAAGCRHDGWAGAIRAHPTRLARWLKGLTRAAMCCVAERPPLFTGEAHARRRRRGHRRARPGQVASAAARRRRLPRGGRRRPRGGRRRPRGGRDGFALPSPRVPLPLDCPSAAPWPPLDCLSAVSRRLPPRGGRSVPSPHRSHHPARLAFKLRRPHAPTPPGLLSMWSRWLP